MHTFLNRANAVFAYAFSCVATVTLCCYLSTAYVSANAHTVLTDPNVLEGMWGRTTS